MNENEIKMRESMLNAVKILMKRWKSGRVERQTMMCLVHGLGYNSVESLVKAENI